MTAPRVRVVIVNYNSGGLLRNCIDHLIAQTEQLFEAVIIDNGSNDGSLSELPHNSRIRTVELNENKGFATANNIGCAGCTAPFVALLNPDAFADPNWLRALLAAAEAEPDYHAFGSLQRRAADVGILDGAGDAYFCAGAFWRGGYGRRLDTVPPHGETFAVCAAAALFRTETFAAAGGFDEDFFCYAEDIDLSFRIRLMGGRCLQVGSAVVDHVGSATTGVGSDFSVYYLTRNGLWTFVKCMPDPLLALLAPAHLLLQAWIWFRARTNNQSAVVARGLRDGMAGLPAILKKRRAIQGARVASSMEIARQLVWSPRLMRQKAIVLRPVRGRAAQVAAARDKEPSSP